MQLYDDNAIEWMHLLGDETFDYRCLLQDEVAEFDGEFVSFKNVIALPKPVQQPGPPRRRGTRSTAQGRASRRRLVSRVLQSALPLGHRRTIHRGG